MLLWSNQSEVISLFISHSDGEEWSGSKKSLSFKLVIIFCQTSMEIAQWLLYNLIWNRNAYELLWCIPVFPASLPISFKLSALMMFTARFLQNKLPCDKSCVAFNEVCAFLRVTVKPAVSLSARRHLNIRQEIAVKGYKRSTFGREIEYESLMQVKVDKIIHWTLQENTKSRDCCWL